MPSFQDIYTQHADRYDDLVRHEDAGRALDACLAQLLDPRVERIVELGCGTGRVTRILARHAAAVRAYDGAPHMVDFARTRVADPHVVFGVADNAALPEPDASADAVVAGWTIGHVTGFFPDTWRAHAARALTEMRRVGRPGSTLIVIETLGTAVDAPAPPNPDLAALYAMFEEEHGFRRRVLDTRYVFSSLAHAAETMGFFFGDAKREAVEARGLSTVPEFTGVWTR